MNLKWTQGRDSAGGSPKRRAGWYEWPGRALVAHVGESQLFLIAFIIGMVVAIVIGVGFPAALVGGVIGALLAFLGQAVWGFESMRRGRDAVPVDLDMAIPDPLTQEAYERLPLAGRNAVVVREVATATGKPMETIAALLPVLMGRSRMSSLASQRGAQSVMESLDPLLWRSWRASSRWRRERPCHQLTEHARSRSAISEQQ